jgi:hypothetical protein
MASRSFEHAAKIAALRQAKPAVQQRIETMTRLALLVRAFSILLHPEALRKRIKAFGFFGRSDYRRAMKGISTSAG